MADKDDLSLLWRGQTTGPPKKGEEMLTMVIDRTYKFDRKIKGRNIRECAAGVLVAGLFALVAWNSPNLLARAGNALVAASGVWVIVYLLRFGRAGATPATDCSLADFQQALLRKYDDQIRLLKRVKFWYLLPPYVGLLMASAGIVMANIAKGQPYWPQLIAMVSYSALFAVVWWLNESFAARKLEGRRQRLLEEMQSTAGD